MNNRHCIFYFCCRRIWHYRLPMTMHCSARHDNGYSGIPIRSDTHKVSQSLQIYTHCGTMWCAFVVSTCTTSVWKYSQMALFFQSIYINSVHNGCLCVPCCITMTTNWRLIDLWHTNLLIRLSAPPHLKMLRDAPKMNQSMIRIYT